MKISEVSVIGCLAEEPPLIEKARLKLTPEMFEEDQLADIYRFMLEGDFDLVSLIKHFGDDSKAYFYKLTQTGALPQHIDNYIDMVFEDWRVREIKGYIAPIMLNGERADEMVTSLAEIVEKQRQLVSSVQDATEKKFIEAALEAYENMFKPDTSLKTDWSYFNRVIGGLQRGGLYIIAARPGAGKSDFSIQMATQLAKRYHVRYQTMEMSEDQVLQRILSRACRINSIRIRDKQLNDGEASQMATVISRMEDIHLIIDEQGALTFEKISAATAQSRPDALFIDYLGLMDGGRKDKKEWELTSVLTRQLKELARKYNMAVVVLVQLNRQTDRSKSKPTLADLRGGGSVEADADCVMFVRPEDVGDRIISGSDFLAVDIQIAKNRHGSMGTLRYNWQPQYHTYNAVDTRYEE